MPRQSQRSTRKSGASQSQRENLSQTRVDEHFAPLESQVDVSELVNTCVRYLLYKVGPGVVFRKADISKQLTIKSGHQFQDIINGTTQILKNVRIKSHFFCQYPIFVGIWI